MFFLSVNDDAFLKLPFQASVALTGPQNIDKGEIILNEVLVHDGFKQYTDNTVNEWREEHKLQPTTDIYICFLTCSSSSVLNSMFDDLGRSIDQ